MQTKLRTYDIIPNENICFPIGTILTVEKLYNVLDFPTVFGKHKKNGIDINDLLKALVSYKLTDNFSISKAHNWINRAEVLDIFDLEEFSERTLYRVLETVGKKIVKQLFPTFRTNCFHATISNIPTSTWTGRVSFFMGINPLLENTGAAGTTDPIKSSLP